MNITVLGYERIKILHITNKRAKKLFCSAVIQVFLTQQYGFLEPQRVTHDAKDNLLE